MVHCLVVTAKQDDTNLYKICH